MMQVARVVWMIDHAGVTQSETFPTACLTTTNLLAPPASA